MAYTNHKDIRLQAGFWNLRTYEEFRTDPDGSTTKFYIDNQYNGDVEKIVTIGSTDTLSADDVTVFYGASGANGVSVLGVSSLDADLGYIELSVAPDSGSSVTVTYASSPVQNEIVESVRLEAESTVNNVLSECYTVPLSTTVSEVNNLAAKLAAGYLLIRNYGSAAIDTAADGYKLVDYVLGIDHNAGNGRLYWFCKTEGRLVDDSGSEVAKKTSDEDYISASKTGGIDQGDLFTIDQENFVPEIPTKSRTD